MPKEIILTRRVVFSASHQLASPKLSAQENEKLFGKCFNPSGHGHNYTLEVSLKGQIDPKTGILFNLTDLKSVIESEVLNRVDHKHLNLDVAEFKSVNPTTENLAVVIWGWLEAKLPHGILFEVLIRETENNFVSYRGDSHVS